MSCGIHWELYVVAELPFFCENIRRSCQNLPMFSMNRMRESHANFNFPSPWVYMSVARAGVGAMCS